MGNGTDCHSLVPTYVNASFNDPTPLRNIKAISSGGSHTCALTNSNHVKCWGSGRSGQLGDKRKGRHISTTPVDVHTSSENASPLDNIKAISSGGHHTCALTNNNHVKCWGSSQSGQRGDKKHGRHISATPVDVHTSSANSSPLGNIKAISSGGGHTCALTLSGHVKCWGNGKYGQLGNSTFSSDPIPTIVNSSSMISAPLHSIKAISSGERHTCAITHDSRVKCWGNGDFRQFARIFSGNSSTPIDIAPTFLKEIKAISSRAFQSCALTNNRLLKCWGQGAYGSPFRKPSEIKAVSSGGNHNCAINKLNKVLCWGRGGDGQLGDGTSRDSSNPVSVKISSIDPILLGNVREIISGINYTCVLTSNNNVKCWGMGYGHVPVDVDTISKDLTSLSTIKWMSRWASTNPSKKHIPVKNIKTILSNHNQTCILSRSGKVKCWEKGKEFKNLFSTDIPTSGTDTTPLSNIKEIGSGRYYVCALTNDGHVKCWGDGSIGALGNGKQERRDSIFIPVDVHTSAKDSSPLSNIKTIGIGNDHACALTNDGHVKCWGNERTGALGNGKQGKHNSLSAPVDVHTSSANSSPLGNIKTISSGVSHTCALTTRGNVKCWGRNEDGQLGSRVSFQSLVPVNVHTSAIDSTPLGNIKAIISGGNYVCALTNDGHVKCWGQGESGVLGNGKENNSTIPVDVRTNPTNISLRDCRYC